jgi:predicted amidohydrolase
MSFVNVAAIQFSSELCETEKNIQKATELLEEAAKKGTKIAVLPEACINGYVSQDMKTNWRIKGRPIEKQFINELDLDGFGETVPGKATDHFCNLSKKLKMYIAIPIIEVETEQEQKERESKKEAYSSYFKNIGPKYYNTLCLSSPEGKLVGHYRKIFPWWYPEKSWASSGQIPVTFDTEYGRVGFAVCFDIHNILRLIC